MNKDLNKLMRSYQFKLVRTTKHYKWEGPNRSIVFINYVKGETDAKGFTPNANRTILIDNNDTRITCLDYTQLEVISQITDDGRLI